jgi:hypothetical protein
LTPTIHAGVVADDVNAVQRFAELLHFAFARNVDLHRIRLDSQRFHLGRDVRQWVHVCERHVHALARESEGHGAAQAACRAGDRRRLSLQVLHAPISMNATA